MATTGQQVASLFGLIGLDNQLTSGLKEAKDDLKSFGQTLSDNLKTAGQQLTGFGVSLTAIGAPFLGIAAKGQQAWDAWDDALDQTRAVLKSTGDAVGYTSAQLIDMADALQDSTGFTKTSIVEAQNLELTFTNIGHNVFPRMTKATLDMSVAMKQDLKSSAIQLGKALNSPKDGLTALTRVGVTFTQQQKDMITAMQDAGDIAGAQGVILSEIEREFGGSAAAAVDPIDRLNTKVNDLFIGLGYSLQPALESVINFLTPLIDGFTALTNEDGMPEVIGLVLALGAGLAIIGPIIAAIGIGLTALGGIVAFVFSPIGIIIAVIVGAILLMQQAWGDLFQAIGAGVPIVDILRAILFRLLPEDVAQGIVTAITNIRNWLGGLVDTISQFVTKHPEFVVAVGAIGVAVGILTLVMSLASGATSILAGAVGLLTGALGLLFSPFVLVAVAIGALLAVATSYYPGGLVGLLKDAALAAQELAAISLKTFLDTINEAVQTLTTIWNIIDLIKNGKVTPGQVLGAVGSEISNNAGGPGSSGGNVAAALLASHPNMVSGGVTVNGPVTVQANNTAQFEKELNDRYRGRG